MDERQKLVIAEMILLCLIVVGNFANIISGFIGFLAYESVCVLLFFVILYLIKKEFEEYRKYIAYFVILLVLVLYVAWALVNIEKVGPKIDLFLFIILAIVVVNVIFRVILGKREVSGRVLLSDEELAVVEVPFDLFAGINHGKYVVKTNRKLKKNEKVKVRIKRSFFRKVPERIV